MTDYSKMSGYEINNRVHNIVVCGGKYDLTVEGYRVTWKNRETGEEIVTLSKQYDKQFKDYIGSWADAGPVIVANNISLHAPRYKEGWMAEFTGSDDDVNDGFDVDYFESHNDNPLRAALIVFLMMQEKP